jgi:hypothetical protein
MCRLHVFSSQASDLSSIEDENQTKLYKFVLFVMYVQVNERKN